MSKALKTLIRDELDATFSKVDGGVFVSYFGLDSATMYALRSSFNKQGVTMQVVPNRIAAKVLAGRDIPSDRLEEILVGDIAFVHGESAVAAARAVRERIRDGVAIKFKGGLIERDLLDASGAERLADLPTRPELFSQIAFCFQASAQRIAGCFQQTYKQIAGDFVSLADKLEKDGNTGGGAA